MLNSMCKHPIGLLIIISMLFVFHNPVSLFSQELQLKPILIQENFDTLATKISLKYMKDGVEQIQDIGTGFFVIGNDSFIYLVSAGHVFKEALKFLLDNKGAIFIHQELTVERDSGKQTNFYNIDLMNLWKSGLLQLNEEKDIGIVRLIPFNNLTTIDPAQKKEGNEHTQKDVSVKDEKRLIFRGINLLSQDQIVKYEEIRKAEEVYFFGYPNIPGLRKFDKTHLFTPLIRRGIVSKKIDDQRIVIEGFASGGSSGSPVFLRREFFQKQGNEIKIIIKTDLIGVITTTFFVKQNVETNIETADLALVESVDSIVNTFNQFKNEGNK